MCRKKLPKVSPFLFLIFALIRSNSPAAVFPLFYARVDYHVGHQPCSVAADDFNGDGIMDMAILIESISEVSILLGSHNGTFQRAVNYSVGGRLQKVITGDFNADGNRDLAIAVVSSSGSLAIICGNGDGSFQGAVFFGAGYGASSLETGYFNSDEIRDFAVLNTDFTISIFIGQGDASFQEVINFQTELFPSEFAVGDFDGDIVDDLVVANPVMNSVSIFIGNGDGTFHTLNTYSFADSPWSVTVGDFNNDDNDDLVVGRYDGKVSILLGNGDGTFQGMADYEVGSGRMCGVSGDFNNDSNEDLAVALRSDSFEDDANFISILLGHGDGTFTLGRNYSVGASPRLPVVEDLNGDGKADLAVVNWMSANVSIMYGNGDGSFQAAVDMGVGAGPNRTVIADFNRDGNHDLAVGNRSSSDISILLGRGNGSFLSSARYDVPERLSSMAMGDFDNDGQQDLVVVTEGKYPDYTGSVVILMGNRDGSFQPPSNCATGTYFISVSIGDVNNDGDQDLAIASCLNSTIAILIGNGNGFFSSGESYSVRQYPQSITMGDVNRDGNIDMAIASSDGHPTHVGTLSILLGNGNGTFYQGDCYGTGKGSHSVVSGDFNEDFVEDMAVVNCYGDDVRILIGNGNGTFQSAASYTVGLSPKSVVIGDFNGDMNRDLAVANSLGCDVTILLGNGNGVFQNAGSYGTGQLPYAVAAADLNVDGRDDIVTANYASNTISFLFNYSNLLSVKPVVLAGGYWQLPGTEGGSLSFLSLVEDVDGLDNVAEVSICYGGSPAGIRMLDDGAQNDFEVGDGIYGFHVQDIGRLPNTIKELLEIRATDYEGNESILWPYLTVTQNTVSRSLFLVSRNENYTPQVPSTLAQDHPSQEGNNTPHPGFAGAPLSTSVLPRSTGRDSFKVSSINPDGSGHGTGLRGVYEKGPGRPEIKLAGYMDTEISTAHGGQLTMFALAHDGDGADDIATVEVHYNGVGTGIFLDRVEENGAYATYQFSASIFPGAPAGCYLFELVATDHSGNQSLRWPYLVIEGGSPKEDDTSDAVSATPVLDVSRTPTPPPRALASPGSFCFQPAVDYGTGQRPYSVASADFNGDGQPDMAAVNMDDFLVAVHLGNGDGTFQTARYAPTGAGPIAIETADFDRDGNQDVAVANVGDDDLSIFLGNGNGTFRSRSDYPVGINPYSVAAGDFNSDGSCDLAVANNGSDNVSILLGKDAGTFNKVVNYATWREPNWIVARDISGDGILDLATANWRGYGVSVLEGNGDGTFQAATHYTAGYQSRCVAIEDLDIDGFPDLVVANESSDNVSVLRGSGGGTFQPAVHYWAGFNPWCVVVEDFDGDGRRDIAVANYTSNDVSVLKGNGDASFHPPVNYVVRVAPTTLTVDDFNGDLCEDLAAGNSESDTISVLLNCCSPLSPTPANTPTCTGSPYPATPTPTASPGGTETPVSPCFDPRTDYSVEKRSFALCVTDCDGDAVRDLIVANMASQNVAVMRGVSDGSFRAPRYYPAGDGPISCAAGDLDGDGDQDVVVANVGGGTVSILRGNGDGTFQAPVDYTVGNSPYSVALGDFDGDRVLDLAVANDADDDVSILVNNGSGMFSAAVHYPAGDQPQSVVVSDLNGDGAFDLAVANWAGNDLSILMGNGNGTFQPAVGYRAGTWPRAVLIDDLNGDGEKDLVAANEASDDISILLGSGSGVFHPAVQYHAGNNPRSAVTGDFNGDGTIDIAVANEGGYDLSVLSGNGDGTFQVPEKYGVRVAPTSITTADFNHDGCFDLAVANSGSSAVSVLLNCCLVPIPTPTSFPSPSPTIVMTCTMTAVPTPTVTPTVSPLATMTPVASARPNVMLGGYWEQPQSRGGPLTMLAYVLDQNGVRDIDEVEMCHAGLPMGLSLQDDGTQQDFGSGDGIYGFHLPDLGPAPGGLEALLEICAVDHSGNESGLWPYLTVTSGTTTHAPGCHCERPEGARQSQRGSGGERCRSLFRAQSRNLVPRNDTRAEMVQGTVSGSPPEIKLAGYMDTEISTEQGGQLTMFALVHDADGAGDIASVEVYYQGSGTGILLDRIEENGAYASYQFSEPIAPGVPAGRYLFELVATDHSGNESLIWPYLIIKDSTIRSCEGSYTPTTPSSLLNASSSHISGSETKKIDATKAAASTSTVPLFCDTRMDYPVGDNPETVHTSDLNADGNRDIIVANYLSNDISVLLATGDGNYAPAQTFPTGTNPVSIAIGEMDGDGIEDIAVANEGSNNVSILLGYGDGTFRNVNSYTVGALPASVVMGDFNRDGAMDLAVANSGSNKLSILMGNNSGSFQRGMDVAVGWGPAFIAQGDLNENGNIDLVVANKFDNNISVLFGHGDGSFQTGMYHAVGAGPLSIIVDDINGNGHQDIAVGNEGDGTISIFSGDGTGFFQQPVSYFALGVANSLVLDDLNRDGIRDLVTITRGTPYIHSLFGNGDGTFQDVQHNFLYSVAGSIMMDDLNGDGASEIVLTFYENNCISVYFSEEAFADWLNRYVGSKPRALVAGDFNDDQKKDLAVACSGGWPFFTGSVSILFGNGDGTFESPREHSSGTSSEAIAVGDFDGDGMEDLAIANLASNDVTVLLGNTSGNFLPAVNFSAGQGPASLCVWDFNRDGAEDLAVANSLSDNISILRGTGDGIFSSPVNYHTGDGPFSVSACDFNGDGIQDLAAANFSSDTLSILIGNGDGSFQSAVTTGVGRGPIQIAVDDYDNTGTLDCAIACSGVAPGYQGHIAILLGNGDGTFQPPVDYGAGSRPWSIFSGEFNGDGIQDLAVTNFESDNMSLFFGDGDGTFQNAIYYGTVCEPVSGAVNDYNNDGKPDVAVVGYADDTYSMLINCDQRSSHKPNIYLAGYWELPGEGGGPLSIVAHVNDCDGLNDIREVLLYHTGFPMGLSLQDDGTQQDFGPGDGIYGFFLPDLGPAPGGLETLLEICAVDHSGSESSLWPYLTVTSGTTARKFQIPPVRQDDVNPKSHQKITVTSADIKSATTDDVVIADFSVMLPDRNPRVTTARGPTRPEIKLAGYLDSEISTAQGGQLTMFALVYDADGAGDIASVEVYYQGSGTGILLDRIEENGAYASCRFTAPIAPGVPAGRYLFELVATDHSGNESLIWPYLIIEGNSRKSDEERHALLPPTHTPTPTPTDTPTPTPLATGDCPHAVSVTGMVSDAVTGQPVANAQVSGYLSSSQDSDTTDYTGQYRLSLYGYHDTHTLQVDVSAAGYQSATGWDYYLCRYGFIIDVALQPLATPTNEPTQTLTATAIPTETATSTPTRTVTPTTTRTPTITPSCAPTQTPFVTPTRQVVIHVDASNAGFQDGSLEYPYATIAQAIITGALEIRIAEGTYQETVAVYPGLAIKGGYESQTWMRDWEMYPTIIIGQEWAVLTGSVPLEDNEISGLRLTGVSGVTRCGIWLENVSGAVVISDNEIFGLQGPAGENGENCDWVTSCPDLYGGPAPVVCGIYTHGYAITISGNTIHNLTGGAGGAGGAWNYAAGHTEGGDGGNGADVCGIDADGTVENNRIWSLTGGDGGMGAGGFDDTGYGGYGGDGGDGGMVTGIQTGVQQASLYNNVIHSLSAGNGGSGGGGSACAYSGRGGAGGNAFGINDGNGSLMASMFITVAVLSGGNGGDGGDRHSEQYCGYDVAGGNGGGGGSAYSVYTARGTSAVTNSILVGTSPGTGGSGGYGTPYGQDGAAGGGYGIYETQTAPAYDYNNVWDHATALYHNTAGGISALSSDPFFATGPEGSYCLSQVSAGQSFNSPCVDAGDPGVALPAGTTRTDGLPDSGVADIGYHYPVMTVPTPTVTPEMTPTVMPTPTSNPRLDFTVLLHGVYDAADPESSSAVSGEYGIAIELRDNAAGTGSNYRYFGIAFDRYGAMEEDPLDLGVFSPGDYYLVVSQLNHLPVMTDDPLFFDNGTTVTVNFSDPFSPEFATVRGENVYHESNGVYSLHSGNGNTENGQARYINVLDAYVWLYANGTTPGSPNWDIRADYDANGVVNVLDAYKWLQCNGAGGTVSVEPLEVAISSPPEEFQTGSDTVIVTGTVNDNNASMEVNGVIADVAGGTFTAVVPLPVMGNNTITATAGDGSGAIARDSRTVTRL